MNTPLLGFHEFFASANIDRSPILISMLMFDLTPALDPGLFVAELQSLRRLPRSSCIHNNHRDYNLQSPPHAFYMVNSAAVADACRLHASPR